MHEGATDRYPQGDVRRASRARQRSALLVVLVATLLLSLTVVASAQPSPTPRPIGLAPETFAPGGQPATTAPTWEYRTLFVTWDSQILNWVADFSDGTRIEGLDAILNNEGRNGWELVAVMPEQWAELVDDAIIQEVRRLRIFMKKPVG